MPTYLPKSLLKPDFVDNPSVFDPLYKRAIRGVVKGLGLDDAQAALPTPTSLASIVTTAAKAAPALKNTVSSTAGRLEKLLAARLSESPAAAVVDPEAKLARQIFDHSINDATEFSKNRLQRQVGMTKVNNAYQGLADKGLAAPPDELVKLREAVKGINLRPKPTGMDVTKHHVAILNKLSEHGYAVTPQEATGIWERLQAIAGIPYKVGGSSTLRERETGEYVRQLKKFYPTNSPITAVLNKTSGWGDKPLAQSLKRPTWRSVNGDLDTRK